MPCSAPEPKFFGFPFRRPQSHLIGVSGSVQTMSKLEMPEGLFHTPTAKLQGVRPMFHRFALRCATKSSASKPSSIMKKQAKSLQATRDGRSSSASRFTLVGPARLRSGLGGRRIENMKTSLSLLLLGLMLGGCSKPSVSRTFSPAHTNLEVRIMSKISGEGSQPLQFRGHIIPRWDLTVTCGGLAYSAAIEYKGTQNDRDYYWVALTLPQGAVGVPAPAEIAYDGQPIGLWSDSKASIGIQPTK